MMATIVYAEGRQRPGAKGRPSISHFFFGAPEGGGRERERERGYFALVQSSELETDRHRERERGKKSVVHC
ncbi:Uncharacterized protein TCM_021835 [Theobroma cacao]|uniref:Uncharacterized protein n=1 Tax=Theobroma cacao TaxID=3641 RepID=A0A061EQP8_THECC|nr:Uncharacterized protein TCM_021835 [Theobroma cacao]